MRPRGMTDAMIEAAQREVRGDAERLHVNPAIAAKAVRLRATVEDIRREWERKAAEGDLRAQRLLRECYPEATEAVEAAAGVLAHWQDKGDAS
jgi:succinylarginine dihydrolase